MSTPPTEQQTKIDRFTLNEPALAQGQHTWVYEVSEGAQRLAMKLLLDHAYKDPAAKSALKTEFQIGKNFDHPSIIKYHELVMNRQHGYFTMELFRAPNLKAQIYSDLRGVQTRIKRIIELICLALEHVHEKGWVHKDVKPDNVLVNKAGEVRLIDFSLGGRATSTLGKLFNRKTGLVQGTRSYMSPEQILQKTITPATDQYSFGILLFETLTGQTPFKGATPKDLLVRHCNEKPPSPSFFNPNVTPEMDRLVLRLLEKKADKRFKNITEFLLEFRRVNVWKEAIEDTLDQKKEDAKETGLNERRDSRSDALRTAAGTQPVQSTAAPAAKPGAPAQPAAAAKPGAPAPKPAAAPAAPVKAAAPVKSAAPVKAVAPAPQQPGAPQPRPAGQPAPGQPAAAKPPAPQSLAARPPAPAPAKPAAAATAGQPPRPQPAPAAGTRPAAAPSRPAGAPAPAAARPPAPAPARPAAPPVKTAAPVRPAPAKAVKATPPPEGSMSIDDLPSFDDLPSVS